jgi:hypothetical protein
VNKVKDFTVHQPLLLMAEQTDIFVEPCLYFILYYQAMPADVEGSQIYFEIRDTNFMIGNDFE